MKTFSTPGLHRLVYADDYFEQALDIRRELLDATAWVEMRQDTHHGHSAVRFDRQSGITTGHLDDERRATFPHSLAFSDFLADRLADVCAAASEAPPAEAEIEMNAMAYGHEGWLSPHTDHVVHDQRSRLFAWMLYLTHPDDGEWSPEKGGAVRLFDATGGEVRLRPKFNRFALFKVSDASFHEIERVTWACEWDRCRLALSGWIRGVESAEERRAPLYVRRSDADAARAEQIARLRGALAMYGLMRRQRLHSGLDTAAVDETIARCEREQRAHLDAPAGTLFLKHAPGPAWCMFVVDDKQQIVYFGPREGYRVS
jgi:Rps23 Pro-64 3,4-dihydroxylase Tpa1-like proline 4-hydroxylase